MDNVLFIDLHGRLFIRPIDAAPTSEDWDALAKAIMTWGTSRGLRSIPERCVKDIRNKAQHLTPFLLTDHGEYMGWRSEYMGGITRRSFIHLCER